MKKPTLYLAALVIVIITITSGFTRKDYSSPPLEPSNEFEVLLDYLETNENFVNTTASEAIITSGEVKKYYKNEYLSSVSLSGIKSNAFVFGSIDISNFVTSKGSILKKGDNKFSLEAQEKSISNLLEKIERICNK